MVINEVVRVLDNVSLNRRFRYDKVIVDKILINIKIDIENLKSKRSLVQIT